jgi:precorrin isomerase
MPGGGTDLVNTVKTKVHRYQQQALNDVAELVGTAAPRKIGVMDRITYMRDKWIEKSGSQIVMMVFSLTLLVFLDGYIYKWAKDPATGKACDENYWECLWTAWTYMADPGTHADEESISARIIGGFISATGIFFFATVLGFVVDNVREIMDALKKGKSVVVERDHVLILGWTDRCPALLREIALACESDGGGTVVILAEEEKMTLEAELTAHLSKADMRGLHVVFRNGSSMVLKDLETVSAERARAIIVLAQMHGEADKADAIVLRTILQLKSLRGGLQGHVVAEMRDVDNESLVQMVGGGCVETVVSHDIVGRLMLMAARQPGLASVYDSILGFEGDEFYLKEWPILDGMKFGSLQARFPEAIPLGVKRGESNEVIINPDDDMICEAGDEILVLAADDDTYCVKAPITIVDNGTVPTADEFGRRPEDILMCGWRRDVDDIIREMDTLLVRGSNLHMLNEVPPEERERKLLEGGLQIEELKNITLVHHVGNSSVRRHIEGLPLENFDSILVLADEQRETDMMHSDSHTLASLLLIRDIQHQHSTDAIKNSSTVPTAGKQPKKHSLVSSTISRFSSSRLASLAPFLQDPSIRRADATSLNLVHNRRNSGTFREEPKRRESWLELAESNEAASGPMSDVMAHCLVVCEVLDHRTRNTISASPALNNSADFVQSNEFVSRVLAMVAERREIKCVLDDLLGSTGARFCVKSAEDYMGESETLSFFALAARVRSQKAILCGYKELGQLPNINPSNKTDIRSWSNVDLLVIANHHSHADEDDGAADAATALSSSSTNVSSENQAWGAAFKQVQDAASAMSAVDREQFLSAVNCLKNGMVLK